MPDHPGPGVTATVELPVADLAVVNGRLVTPEGVHRGGLTVQDGKIAELVMNDERRLADKVIDAAGHYILPGLVDSHVHFRTPGLTHKEDWAHGSRAAAVGGITTVIDMPNTVPPLFDPADADAKAAAIAGTSVVDFCFHLGVDGARPELLASWTPRQAVSAKVFMAGHHTAPHVIRAPDVLDRIFATAAKAELQLVLHAEDDAVNELLDGWSGPPREYRDYEPRRPRTGSIVAVAKVIELVRRHGTVAHILHVSSAEEVDLLCAAAHAGLPVTFEVTPHHLSFTAADTDRLGARVRLSPAIRREADQRRLWDAVRNGEVTTIGSDHAPHTRAEKARRLADAPPGLPGVQELLPAIFTGLRRRFPDDPVDRHVSRIAELVAAAPADLFGLAGQKGRLKPGLDADFTLFDPAALWMVRAEDMVAKCSWSAYEGWTMTGRVELTIRRGKVIWDRDSHTFGDPTGRWLDTSPGPASGESQHPTHDASGGDAAKRQTRTDTRKPPTTAPDS
jgi:dihydroorotase